MNLTRESPIPQGQLPDQNLERTKAADRIEQLERAHARSQGVEADLAAMLVRAERAEAELAALRHERDDPIAAAMGRAAPAAPEHFYLDFLCTDFPACGCKEHTEAACARTAPAAPEED